MAAFSPPVPGNRSQSGWVDARGNFQACGKFSKGEEWLAGLELGSESRDLFQTFWGQIDLFKDYQLKGKGRLREIFITPHRRKTCVDENNKIFIKIRHEVVHRNVSGHFSHKGDVSIIHISVPPPPTTSSEKPLHQFDNNLLNLHFLSSISLSRKTWMCTWV